MNLSYKLWHLSLREVAVRSKGLSLAHLLQGICFLIRALILRVL